MKKYLLPLVLLFLAVSLGIYYSYGGFSKVQVNQKQSTTKLVAGQYYEGPARSAEFSELFKKAGKLVQINALKGRLGGIYYNNPEEAKGHIKAFIGVVVNDSAVALPPGYELRTLPAGQPVLEAYVKANHSLIPGKAYPALFDYAREHNIRLKPLYFEEYFSQQSGAIWIYQD